MGPRLALGAQPNTSKYLGETQGLGQQHKHNRSPYYSWMLFGPVYIVIPNNFSIFGAESKRSKFPMQKESLQSVVYTLSYDFFKSIVNLGKSKS